MMTKHLRGAPQIYISRERPRTAVVELQYTQSEEYIIAIFLLFLSYLACWVIIISHHRQCGVDFCRLSGEL